jgi:hypothetical protein
MSSAQVDAGCRRNYQITGLVPSEDGGRWLVEIEQNGARRIVGESPHEWVSVDQLDRDTWGFSKVEERILRRGFDRKGRPVGPDGRRVREENENGLVSRDDGVRSGGRAPGVCGGSDGPGLSGHPGPGDDGALTVSAPDLSLLD